MKKFLFFILALCCTAVAKAQGTDQFSAILQHGDEVSVYEGATGFQQAYAAAVDGDVIILSQGTFKPVSKIEKSLTILGAGFEQNDSTNTAISAFDNNVSLGKSDGVLDYLHIEGVKIMGTIYVESELKNTHILKSFITGDVRLRKNIETMTLKQCRISGSVYGDGNDIEAHGLHVANCYLGGNVRNFSYNSSVNVDHCYMVQYSNGDKAQILLTNTIIGGTRYTNATGVPNYATVKNCIVFSSAGGFPSSALVETYHRVDLATIFADAENTDYSESRTFELKDPETYKGTDGTPIGLSGGAGWNKVPSRPFVSNLSATPSGTNLNVTYNTSVK